MEFSKLQTLLESAPARVKEIERAVASLQKEETALELFLGAIDGLKTSWRDSDPGKYGPHWYATRHGKKAWPRELISRAKRDDRKPDPAALCDFKELDHKNCPACKRLGAMLCCYQQTEDTPFGDTWTKTFYVLCAPCKGLVRAEVRTSDGRF